MASDQLAQITDENFEQEVLNSSQPVLVDFFTTWCQPCKLLAPTIEKLAADYAGRVKVAKIDAEENMNSARKYCNAFPTVVIFKDGQVVQAFVGLRRESDYRSALDAALE